MLTTLPPIFSVKSVCSTYQSWRQPVHPVWPVWELVQDITKIGIIYNDNVLHTNDARESIDTTQMGVLRDLKGLKVAQPLKTSNLLKFLWRRRQREGGEWGKEEKEGRRRKRGGGRFSYKFMLLRYVELSLASLIPRQTTALCTTASLKFCSLVGWYDSRNFWLQDCWPCEPITDQNSKFWLDSTVLTLATGCRKTLEKRSTAIMTAVVVWEWG